MDNDRIAFELVRIARDLVAREPALTIKIDGYNFPTDKAKYRKYGVRLVRHNSNDTMILKGTRENLIELMKEYSLYTKERDIQYKYPELKSDDRKRFDKLKKDILSDNEKWGSQEEKALVKALFQKHDFTVDDLNDWDDRNLKYKTGASEYISMSTRASVWTYTVEGSIKLGGKTYPAKTNYKTEVNSLPGWG